ncbi:hypothetical protein [Streptomyces sannanensis]|uniref:hypothetical protein n=1 Tax=Streptomyces sannanensis TaxID=285536 RepID=UPI003CD07DA6
MLELDAAGGLTTAHVLAGVHPRTGKFPRDRGQWVVMLRGRGLGFLAHPDLCLVSGHERLECLALREHDVTRLVAMGLSNEEISDRLVCQTADREDPRQSGHDQAGGS